MTTDRLAGAFDFARKLRNPQVRERLKLLGYDGKAGDVIVYHFEDESFREASARVPSDARRGLLVARDEQSPSGWWMCWAEKVTEP